MHHYLNVCSGCHISGSLGIRLQRLSAPLIRITVQLASKLSSTYNIDVIIRASSGNNCDLKVLLASGYKQRLRHINYSMQLFPLSLLPLQPLP